MGKKQKTRIPVEGAENLELRSEQLRDLLGQVPAWIIRFGTMAIMLVLLLFILGTIFLKYPDIISARVRLTTETPPAEIVANISARIVKFLVADKEIVEEGQVLVILESAARYPDVEILAEALKNIENFEVLQETKFPNNLQLGPLQDAFAQYQKRLQEYNSFIRLNYYTRKINSIYTELNKYSNYLKKLEEQEKIQEDDYRLAEKQFLRDSALFADRVISSVQLEKSEAQRLNKLFEWKSTQTQLASSQIEVTKLQQEILELELKFEENSRQHQQSLQESVEMLKGGIARWEQDYVIRAPFAGQVSFTRIWTENQYVAKGDVVLNVLPAEPGSIVGKVMLSALGAGKIQEGHRVVIRLDNYPYLEFGTVSGKVTSISLVPSDEMYAVEIRPDSTQLVTNYNLAIAFQQNMPGMAEIITDQRSLLMRIVAPFRSAIQRQKMLKE